ncbi:hypothetical protein [Paenibacillus sp. 1781tsa1]|uniref:hypothetical protein n=1 Tax=Paenibacillus sp. 1781tsa1 TaxID=2953810 RepID=UPI0020A0AE53|nr:hypothetical protein [Paenibacillus sp. 1781tsa1]MCP1186463.1 hypothetical protein [Paenibacillus sp. 1781tsa1]
MKIKSIARDFSKNMKFGSTLSLLEYDVLLIDLLEIVNQYTFEKLKEYPVGIINLDDLGPFERDLYRKRKEIEEFLNLGRTIFVFTPPPVYVRPHSDYASKEPFDLREALLPSYPKTDISKGYSVELVGDSLLKPLFTKYEKLWCYESSYKHNFGKPLLKIKDTNTHLSAHKKVGEGNLIFIPKLVGNSFDEPEFLDELKKIVKNINLKSEQDSKMTLPDWSLLTQVPGEKNVIEKISKKNDELKMLENEIERLSSDLKSLEELKVLFAGSGTELEIMVGRVFQSLGFSVSEGIPGRDDLILEYNDQVAVVEVKGVKKSAAEKHAAQLEKWVSEYISTNERTPKGILVVNAFNDTPLEERVEKVFPDQMMKYSTNRNHCLISGLDLLALYFYTRENPEETEQVINELLNTCGHFIKYNWKEYISLNSMQHPH